MSTETREAQGILWVCTDCLFARENGELDSEPDREPWSIEPETDVTIGLVWSEHVCDREHWSDGDECSCETLDFSGSSCDACGSMLGGSRHAYTWWAAS